MRNSGKAPTMAVWVICLVLFLIAIAAQFGLAKIDEPFATWSWVLGFGQIAAQFGLAKIDEPFATWSWVLGFGLLLVACRVRGL